MQILFLIDQPLDERNFERFGIQTWIDRGWIVKVWDLTPLAHRRVWKEHHRLGGAIKSFQGNISLRSRSQLRQCQRELQNTAYFIDFAGDYLLAARVKVHLIRRGLVRVICATGAIPNPLDRSKRGRSHRVHAVVSLGPARVINRIVSSFVHRIAAVSTSPGVVVVSGTQTVPTAVGTRAPDIVRAHNLDYDIYQKLRKSFVRPERQFIVFIDQDYCFHPEYIYQGVRRVVTPDRYFPAVCKGLRNMSRSLGMDIRVAAHPRSAYRQRSSEYFEGIPVEFGKTAELIRDCSAVVCHDSTAIQFAVLFRKPLIFVTTDQLDSVRFDTMRKGDVISHFAAELGKTVINLDGELALDWRKELQVDLDKYAEYKGKYIKIEGSDELPFWEVVIRHLETLCSGDANIQARRGVDA